MKPLSIGFSPCPNDTYIFCGLVKGDIAPAGLSLQPESLADVETLNEWAMKGLLDITKLSFHALGHVLDRYVLLNSGSALGRGCGPLLVAGRNVSPDDFARMTVAVPGKYTTAALLLKLYAPAWKKIVMMRYDEIMPAVRASEVDCGVIIHESRFTYKGKGLILITDLGDWWERISGYPIPLGGIAVKRSLGVDLIKKINRAVKASIIWARANPKLCLPYILQHAQELDESVISAHIGLYVNAFSENLGDEGLEAVEFFLRQGREAGVLPASQLQPLVIR